MLRQLGQAHRWDSMTNSAWDVRELAADSWKLLRAARLKALRESPQAFLARHDDVVAWAEPQWRATFVGARWLVAGNSRPIGLVHSVRDPRDPRSREVQSIWVAHDYRKRGVFRVMLGVLAERERRAGAHDLWLWVLEDNPEARQVYERLGFRSEGGPQQVPHFPERHEQRMRLPLIGWSS